MIESFTADGILHERPTTERNIIRRINEFDYKILDKLDLYMVEQYAEYYLGMINPDDCDCDDCDELDASDFLDAELEEECERRGFVVWRTKSVTDALEIEELKRKLMI